MGWGDEIMELAEQEVEKDWQRMPHKVATKVWYAGRKQLQGAPRKLAAKVGSFIPVPGLGSIVNAAIDVAYAKAVDARKKGKQGRYAIDAAEYQTLESLRKAAKFEAKSLKDTLEKIDTNQPKLKDASTALKTALDAFFTARVAKTPLNAPAWKVALALCQRKRYEDKILFLIGTAEGYLEDLKKYVLSSMEDSTELDKDFREELDLLGKPGPEELRPEEFQRTPSSRPFSPGGASEPVRFHRQK
jgi:hypothetical protein